MKGWLKTSLIDYDGKIASVFFYGGCNFSCPFCHNVELVNDYENIPEIDEEGVIAYLNKKKHLYDGVCITGGEPLIIKGIETVINRLKTYGWAIKLDTNGSNFELLKKLIENKKIDYVAMDVKTSLDKYNLAAKNSGSVENVAKSIDYLINQTKVDYELRSTLYPPFFAQEDLPKIAELVKGAKKYYLQQYNTKVTLSADSKISPYKAETISEMCAYFSQFVKVCEVR